MKDLKTIRIEKKLTQTQAAELVGVSLRSYKSYENDEEKKGAMKYKYFTETIEKLNPIDEEHGVVDLEYIRSKCEAIFQKYNIDFCYLYGSYAKAKAGPSSDVDLLVAGDVKGIQYFGMIEDIRVALNKKVDVLDINQLKDNLELTQEILKDGIKIYG